MAVTNKTLKDGAGADFTVAVYTAGRDVAAQSAPVVLSTEDKAALDGINAKLPALVNNAQPVRPGNITPGVNDQGVNYTPGAIWTETVKTGNALILAEGNCAGSSYLAISLDPIDATSHALIEVPLPQAPGMEIIAGLSMSQRTLAQEFDFEYVSTEADDAAFVGKAISSIQQTTTTVTVSTATEHGLKVGDPIGINGVTNDSRLNYPSLVVATAPTATQFTCIAGPSGGVPSLSLGPFTVGTVYHRGVLGGNPNGFGFSFENGTATNATIVERAGEITARSSGVLNANQSTNILTTASQQPIPGAPGHYNFFPSTEYRINVAPDRIQLTNIAVDNAGTSAAVLRNINTLVPNPALAYRLRIRARNHAAISKPVAHIQAVAKTGTTTATVTTQTPHGLTVGDFIATYGVRDQTNFANITAATVVASVIDTTNFTVVWGSAVTANSQSGVVVRVNGGSLPSAQGYAANAIQSVARTANVLTLVGSATWAGLPIGSLVNIAALHDTAGVDLLLDGSYRVRDAVTTTLVLEPVGTAPTGADITTTNCGGALILRTDLRVHYVKAFGFDRNRVELQENASGDRRHSMGAIVTGGLLDSVTTVTTVSTVGTAGTPAVPATPYFVNSAASTNGALILTGTSGLSAFYATNTGAGAAYVKLYNKATAPTVGTDVPEMVIPVPAAVAGVPGVYALPMGFNAFRFPLGLGIAITGAAADADTTAVAAGQVKVKLSRTV